MESSSEKSDGLKSIAALFNDVERKELFRKYLYFLGWVEILILLTCWLYQLGDSGREGGNTFPWRLYFIVAFLAPVGITFLMGIVIVGFNKYFADPGDARPGGAQSPQAEELGAGRIQKLNRMVTWVQRLPFLALLLLLGVSVGFFYKLDAIVSLIGNIGEKSVRILLLTAGGVLILLSVFALILVFLNYKLRKRAMEYQYKSQVAERFGLIILEDNTVLNSAGKLLVNGKRWKDAVQLLPEPPKDDKPADSCSGGAGSRPADLDT
ncbi:MAG: hypothetical protein LLG06_00450 [Desulfobacteraceae bacterium]|nr:hypothetical protein [Desulfobacteraceae bacterium]